MSDLLPIFPLPNVVLFPSVFLPLHVFEPRYRDMVADALAGDRMIGMMLLRPGWEPHYDGRPPVFEVGCTGVITHNERLPDGRYNIVLRGVERFRLIREDDARVYRRAIVEPLPERAGEPDDASVIRQSRARLESMLLSRMSDPLEGNTEPEDRSTPDAAVMHDEDFVHALAQYLELEPLEKQALLERSSLRRRAESLVDLLEMKTLITHTTGLSHLSH